MARKKQNTDNETAGEPVDVIEPESHEDPVIEEQAEADEVAAQEAAGVEESGESADEQDALVAEAQQMRELAQRKQAELENFRKRVERERAETVKYAAVDVVKDLLPILDNLERAIDAANKGGAEATDQLVQGVEIVFRQFRDTLVKQGLEEVEARDRPFDPHFHEAVGRVNSPEHDEGVVVEVFQKGYRFRDRLLRPAMVTVAQSDGDADPGSDSAS